MPDVSLPPVGELVQITTVDGQKLLGVYQHDGGFLLVGPRPDGTGGWWPGWEATDWCRVLGPAGHRGDRGRVAAAIYDTDWGPGGSYDSVRAERRWARASDEGKPIYRAESRSVLAAVRGAAIR